MVCAGYQKKGIVFLKTKFHCASQFRCVMMRVIGIGVRRLRREPPQSRICVSVILWNVMNTGANIVFMATEIGDIQINQSASKDEIFEMLDFYRESMGC